MLAISSVSVSVVCMHLAKGSCSNNLTLCCEPQLFWYVFTVALGLF